MALAEMPPTCIDFMTPALSINTWVGMPLTKYRSLTWPSSMMKVQSYPLSFVNCLTVALSSRISTPRSTRPLSLYLSYRCFISGSSALHGGHQDAQKLIQTGFPLKDESLTGLPVY